MHSYQAQARILSRGAHTSRDPQCLASITLTPASWGQWGLLYSVSWLWLSISAEDWRPFLKWPLWPCQAEKLIRILSPGTWIQFVSRVFHPLEHFGTIGTFLLVGTSGTLGRRSPAHIVIHAKAKRKSCRLEIGLCAHQRMTLSQTLMLSGPQLLHLCRVLSSSGILIL